MYLIHLHLRIIRYMKGMLGNNLGHIHLVPSMVSHRHWFTPQEKLLQRGIYTQSLLESNNVTQNLHHNRPYYLEAIQRLILWG